MVILGAFWYLGSLSGATYGHVLVKLGDPFWWYLGTLSGATWGLVSGYLGTTLGASWALLVVLGTLWWYARFSATHSGGSHKTNDVGC